MLQNPGQFILHCEAVDRRQDFLFWEVDEQIARLVPAPLRNDGTVGIEKLTELSDRDRRVVYDIIGGDPPVDGFTAVITVHEVSEDNRSFVAWSATFDTTGEVGAVADWVRTGIFQTCLAELERVLARRG
jgi:hypothetical protein